MTDPAPPTCVLKRDGRTVSAAKVFDVVEALGVNTRVQLAEVTCTIQRATMLRLMLSGVTVVSPEVTFIDPRAQIGADTVILPFTHIHGPVVIGADCRIGPHAVLEGAVEVTAGSIVPPFSHLRA